MFQKITKTRQECCDENCFIRTFAWTKSDVLITGCSQGVICYYNKEKKFISKQEKFINIIKLELSCNDTYLAVQTFGDLFVFLMNTGDIYYRARTWAQVIMY